MLPAWYDTIKSHKNLFFQCRWTFLTNLGAFPETINWMHTVLMRTKISYASVVWWTRYELKEARDSLYQMCDENNSNSRTRNSLKHISVTFSHNKGARASTYRFESSKHWWDIGISVRHSILWEKIKEKQPWLPWFN